MKKEPKHKQINVVNWSWENREAIPKQDRNKSQIYTVSVDGVICGVGETGNMKDRCPNGYVWKTRTMLPDGSNVIKSLQELAVANGNTINLSFKFLEQCDYDDRRVRESYYIEKFKAEGFPILNTSKPVKEKVKIS